MQLKFLELFRLLGKQNDDGGSEEWKAQRAENKVGCDKDKKGKILVGAFVNYSGELNFPFRMHKVDVK